MENVAAICDFKATLVVIPCSGTKDCSPEARAAGPSILGNLPTDLATRLIEARRVVAIAPETKLDEACLLPAYQRYIGFFYEAAAQPSTKLLRTGVFRICSL